MKVVLDTNVLISGLMLPDSIPGKIVSAWRNAHFGLVLSDPMLAEIAKVLAYPKIANRLQWETQRMSDSGHPCSRWPNGVGKISGALTVMSLNLLG